MVMSPQDRVSGQKPEMSAALAPRHFFFTLAIAAALFLQLAALGQNNVWEPIGLSGQTVYSIAVDPRSDQVIYAGTISGIFKTVDAGASWVASYSGLAGSVRALVIDPTSPDTLYAGTEAGGVLKTTDAGGHWANKNMNLAPTDVWTLAIHPQNPSALFAGTWGGGLFQSGDGGETWNPANGGIEGSIIRRVLFDPVNPHNLYVAVWGGGIYKSTDSGLLWQAVNSGLDSDSKYVRALAVDPVTPSIVYAATMRGIYKSMDSGGHWSSVSGFSVALAGTRSMAIPPNSPQRILAGTDQDLYISQNGGLDWTPYNDGLTSAGVVSLVVSPGNRDQVFAGATGGIFQLEMGCSLQCRTDVPPRVQIGVPVPFEASCTSLLCSSLPAFLWDFGDGCASGEQNPTHAFASPGTYSWGLRVTADNANLTLGGAVVASVTPPCAITCMPAVQDSAITGGSVSFASSGTVAPTCPGQPSYWWDFGDGTTSSEPNPTHAYAAAGFYRWVHTTSVSGLSCTKEGRISILPNGSLPYTLLGVESCPSGSTVRVPLVLASGNSLVAALGAKVAFDASALTPFRVEPSTVLQSSHYEAVWHADSAGKLTLGLLSTFQNAHIQDGIAAYLSFSAAPDATGDFSLGLVGSAADGSGMDLTVGSINGSIEVARPPVTVSVGWTGPGRAECGPPENLTATVNVPGEGGSQGRANGNGTTSPSPPENSETNRASVLLGYDLYRATFADPSSFVKINTALIPEGNPNFLDENPPAGSVAYRAQAVYDTCTSDYSPPAPTQVPPCAIGCSASCDPASGAAPLAVTFAGAAHPSSGCAGDGAYAWNFGDGTASSLKNPQHTYPATGAYTWTLTVSVGGVSSSKQGTVVVGNVCAVSCRASATPSLGAGPLAVAFAATATPGAFCTGPVAYAWSFGDGGSSAVQDPTHTYQREGDYTWRLMVTSGTASFSQSGVIHVCALDCSASASPGAGLPPLSVSFAADSVLSSNCPGAAFYSWTFGDGHTSIAQNPTHVYSAEGDFNWTVTANANGMSASQSGTVHACVLTCSAAAAPPSGVPPLQVSFTSTAEIDGSCAWSPVYSWTFGDGGTARTKDATHTYTAAGTYPWTFTVTGGTTCSQTGTVHVSCDSPQVTAVKRLDDPFRLRVDADALKEGIEVFLGGEAVPWPDIAVKSPTRFVIKNAGRYFPRGDLWVKVVIRNPSGCEAGFEFNWERNQWRPASR